MQHLDLAPITRMAGTVRLPGSKSISNRTLLLAALARGSTTLKGLLEAEDVERMRDALSTLGVRMTRSDDRADVAVHGVARAFPFKQASLFPATAATAFRRLTAVLPLAGGDYELSGVSRMH